MWKKVQSPVSREALREWVEDRYSLHMDVQQSDDKVLTVYNETLFPEISVLFVGDAENFNDTVEICGMYDQRTGEFRFVSGQLSSIVNGISEAECCSGSDRSEDIYAEINGDFTADYSERFTRFGSQDWDHLERGRLQDRQVLIFNSPVPDEQIPEGWHSYHLAGRNIYNVDRLLKAVPEIGYVGTVLSPHVLIRASYQSRQIQDQFQRYAFHVNLAQFCEENHLSQPDMSGIASGQQEKAAPPQMGMGGMS